jgi:hypothetical protein
MNRYRIFYSEFRKNEIAEESAIVEAMTAADALVIFGINNPGGPALRIMVRGMAALPVDA